MLLLEHYEGDASEWPDGPARLSEVAHTGHALSDWQECIAATMYLSRSTCGLSAIEPSSQSAIRAVLRALNEIPDSWAQLVCRQVLK